MKHNILIIGVGGIGSYLAPLLSKTGLYSITIADPDTLEDKNYLTQNYCQPRVMCSTSNLKAKNLEMTYPCTRREYPILTDKQVEGYDLVICCADNLDARRLVYRQGFQSDCMTEWLELRAQGMNGALISYLADPKYSDTFLTGPEGSFSCQGENYNETNDPKDLHFTHVAIAGIGGQWVQRWNNGDELKDKMVINI